MKRRPSTSELLALLPTVDFLISERNQPVTTVMIVAASRLKLIVRLGSLSYDIDVDTARAQGIHVSVQPVLGTIYCAEHALMMILAVLKRLGRSLAGANAAPRGMAVQRTDENTFAYNWLGYTDLDCLHGKTVSILGMGRSALNWRGGSGHSESKPSTTTSAGRTRKTSSVNSGCGTPAFQIACAWRISSSRSCPFRRRPTGAFTPGCWP
jgi:hypothetical protein